MVLKKVISAERTYGHPTKTWELLLECGHIISTRNWTDKGVKGIVRHNCNQCMSTGDEEE